MASDKPEEAMTYSRTELAESIARAADRAFAAGRADEREACARLVEQQKELRSSSWYADLIRARKTP